MAPFIESGYTTRTEWLANGGGKISKKLLVRGMALSHNVIPSVLLAKDTGCGDFEERSSLVNTAPYTISRVD